MTLRRRNYLMEKQLTVRTMVPDSVLDDTELIQRVKFMEKDRQRAWSLFVKMRNLSPGMNAKDFYQIFDSVGPNVELKTVDFVPTHKNNDTPSLTIMVVARTPTQVKYIMSYGGTGSEPIGLFDGNWEAIK